jgi:hypothetical protein
MWVKKSERESGQEGRQGESRARVNCSVAETLSNAFGSGLLPATRPQIDGDAL